MREFTHQGWAVQLERTEGPGHGTELAARAARAGVERVVAIGGDGTVHDVANGLLRHGGDVQLGVVRSEEHTSELQSRLHLVCRLLLEKKKKERIWRHLTADRASYS